MWHVGSVVFWLGSSATFVIAVHPSLRSLDSDERRSFLRSFLPTFSKFLGAASISTVVAGFLLFAYVSSVRTPIGPTGWRFVFVLIGGTLGLIAAILTLGVALPLASRFMDPRSQISNGPRYTVLDEAAIVSGLNSVMRSVVIVLLLAFGMMLLGAYT